MNKKTRGIPTPEPRLFLLFFFLEIRVGEAIEIPKRRTLRLSRSSQRMCSANFTKFTGKYLCRSLFFNKVAGLSHSS